MKSTHSIVVGYALWIFGFLGAHRFYFGKQITGAIWFCTLGLLGVGWIVDFFLIPKMSQSAHKKYAVGSIDYSIAWLLMTYLGIFGLHRFYMKKWVTGLLYLASVGLFGVGIFYDYWTLNQQISHLNSNK